MSELLSQLGINGKLLLFQAINFAIVLTVLTKLLYKPLLKVMRTRHDRIELGIRGAEIADKRQPIPVTPQPESP